MKENTKEECPICKSFIDKNKLIDIYLDDDTKEKRFFIFF